MPHTSPDTQVWTDAERYAGLKLNEYAESARRFVWNELADWYLESLKSRLDAPGADREVARAVLVHAFDSALRLLHPIVPFVTEALWQRLPGRAHGEFLARASWPGRRDAEPAARAREFELVREAVLAIRQIRGDYAVAPSKSIEVFVRPPAGQDSARAVLDQESPTIGRLCRAQVHQADGTAAHAAAHAVLAGGTEIIVPLAGLIDVDKECARMRGEVAELDKQIAARAGRLENPKYVERAPEQIVRNDRATLEEMRSKREQLAAKVRSLCGA
jgi:valyl-tRNA synthetase